MIIPEQKLPVQKLKAVHSKSQIYTKATKLPQQVRLISGKRKAGLRGPHNLLRQILSGRERIVIIKSSKCRTLLIIVTFRCEKVHELGPFRPRVGCSGGIGMRRGHRITMALPRAGRTGTELHR